MSLSFTSSFKTSAYLQPLPPLSLSPSLRADEVSVHMSNNQSERLDPVSRLFHLHGEISELYDATYNEGLDDSVTLARWRAATIEEKLAILLADATEDTIVPRIRSRVLPAFSGTRTSDKVDKLPAGVRMCPFYTYIFALSLTSTQSHSPLSLVLSHAQWAAALATYFKKRVSETEDAIALVATVIEANRPTEPLSQRFLRDPVSLPPLAAALPLTTNWQPG